MKGNTTERGYGVRWARYSKQYRKDNPLCVDCLAMGRLTSVEHGGHVDHIQAVTGPDDPQFWNPANHASRCISCHSRKTAQEDGGFGNAASDRPSKACGMDGTPSDRRHHWNK